MKICQNNLSPAGAAGPAGLRRAGGARLGFTMVEIAICLAIIGLALVSIIGVLPLGMHVQRDNREETVINQDSTVFMESIRNGVRFGADLTNYVYAITNYWVQYNSSMVQVGQGANGYTYQNSFVPMVKGGLKTFVITNNARIIGLLSTPEFTTPAVDGFAPIPSLTVSNNASGFLGGISNHVSAYVRSLSGPAVEKPPQNNDLVIGDSFAYRINAVNAPLATDTNVYDPTQGARSYADQLAANLHELRLTFAWPILPSGAIRGDGPVPQTQRVLVAGSIYQTNDNGQPLYFYQSQSFTNAP